MAQGKKKKRAAWGSKKRAAAAETAAAETAAAGEPSNGHSEPAAVARPTFGDAIENVKNWLHPFDSGERKQILKAVNYLLGK